MKVDTKAGENCTVDLMVNVDAAEVQEPYKGVLKTFVNQARVPGFRPGKAPVQLIKQRFAKEISEEVQGACFRKFYPEALKESKVEAINMLGVKEAKFSVEEGFAFTAVLEVKPTFKLPKYKKLSIDKLDVEVSDKAVDDRVEALRKAYAKYEDAKEGAEVAEGDFVQIDYKGTVDDKPILELAPEAKAVAEGAGFWLKVEVGRFLPEILKAVTGMKIGESKTVKAKFPKDAAPEPLKGKKAVYEVTVKALRACQLPDDEQFLKDAGEESMEKLRATLKEKMLADAQTQEDNRRQEYAVELLLKKADFDVPQSFVRQETQANLQRLASQAQYSGIDASYFEQNREKILAQAEEQATRQVRLSYILAKIAEEEKIEVSDEEAAKRIDEIAANTNRKPEDVCAAIEKNGNMEGLKAQLKAEKALDLVLAESK